VLHRDRAAGLGQHREHVEADLHQLTWCADSQAL
jgi:hypothetical protein